MKPVDARPETPASRGPASGGRSGFPGLLAGLLAMPLLVRAATLSDPAVDRFNVRVGTQTFAPKYQFTTNTALVETAEAIRDLGSDVVKFALGRSVRRQYGIVLPEAIGDLTSLVRDEPSCRRVLDMPFRHFVLWAYCFASTGDAWWKDGFSPEERRKEYAELYDFSRHLLATYSGTGKSFYLGHWEGDWYLLPNYVTTTNPSPTATQGMIDWLATRQQAVDDATRDTPHRDVAVYAYAEVNRVRDAMVNGPSSNRRLVNTVLPAVTNLDFVSWSSYDGQNLDAADLRTTLDYLESRLPTNKAARIPGRRVMIGEYGWGGSLASDAQEPPTRDYLRRLLPWSPRFILFWEMYDNEDKAYWLVDREGRRTPCHDLHRRFVNLARLLVGRFQESRGRLPDDAEFADLVTPALEHSLPEPVALAWSDLALDRPDSGAGTPTGFVARGTLAKGVYGAPVPDVFVCWGRRDGGTARSAWENTAALGPDARFHPTAHVVPLASTRSTDPLVVRFQAVAGTRVAWSPPLEANLRRE